MITPPLARLAIVEDEALIALSAKADLTDAGYEVVGIATDFSSALALATRTRPDLVLMDVRIGTGPDGIETAIHLRQVLDIPSILATGSHDCANHSRAEPARPLGWLEKPYTDQELVAAVSRALDGLAARLPPAPNSADPALDQPKAANANIAQPKV